MHFDNEQLKMMILGKPIGVSSPYCTKDEDTIENYIIDLFQELKRSSHVDCFGEFDHNGSGYASYVELFCFKKDGGSIIQEETKTYWEKDRVWVTSTGYQGIVLYVSRLAPVVIYTRDERYKEKHELADCDSSFETYNKKNSYPGLTEEFDRLPEGDWDNEFNEIQTILNKFGYAFLEKDYLNQKLPFKADIPTLLCMPDFGEEYKVFDSFFYWSD
jgi:hypothetical protein